MGPRFYYLGPPGTFGEQAAIGYIQHAGLEAGLHPLSSHTNVVHAVDSSDGDLGIVAIENSLDGGIAETIDAILAATNVYVRGEFVLPIEHNLIGAPGTQLAQIEVVMSHTSALAQCRGFLERLLPSARLEAALSTGGAVEQALARPGAAAIATRRAAELYDGALLAEGIQDVANNKTRFLVLGREDAGPTGDDKTSIAFTVEDRPGSVVSVMQEFAQRGINLTRIESRPSREELGKYVFLLDFQGHRLEPGPAEALGSMVTKGARLLPGERPLGSYPRYAKDVS